MSIQTISIDQISGPSIQLRPVLKETMDYHLLRESIRDRGMLSAILVRPLGEGFDVVDGANRFAIAQELGFKELDCIVRELTDQEVREIQVLCNVTDIPDKPVDIARRLWKIVNVQQDMTINQLATVLRKHPDWVNRMLNLVNLSQSAKNMLTKGNLCVTIAIEFSKLPISRQDELLDLVGKMPTKELKHLLRDEAREFRLGKRTERRELNLGVDYRFRKMPEVANELEKPTLAATILTQHGATSALDGWISALRWVTQTDN